MTTEKSENTNHELILKMSIYEAIPRIIAAIGAVSKDKRATAGSTSYMYRGIDDVMNALQPLLAKYQVFVVPTVLEQYREDGVTKAGGASHLSIFKIKYTFFANDGTYIEAVTVGEAADTGDKGSNKAMAIAFKYALFQVFCIPTEEMPDPDAVIPAATMPKQKAPTPKQDPPKVDERASIIKQIDKLVYPNRTSEGKGNADGFCYEIYQNELKAYMSLNKDINKLSDLNLNQLKDMLQKMDVPECLR